MTDILLVNPPCTELFFTHGIATSYLPLGLSYLAADLVKAGFDVSGLDADIMGYDEDGTVKHITSENPSVLGLSVMSTTLRSSYYTVRRLQETGFSGDIVVGGPHITALPEAVFEMGLSYGLVGEAEESFTHLCKAIIDGNYEADKIPGVVCTKNREPKPFHRKNLDSIQHPLRSVFPQEKYSHISVMTSRGCPMECSFCHMAKTPLRLRSKEDISLELKEACMQFPGKPVSFVDDNFTCKRNHAIEILTHLQEHNPGLSFNCQSRPDLLDEEMVKALRDAGCNLVFFGVESGNQKIRYNIGKKIPDDEFKRAFSLCNNYGIKTRAYFMLGFPGEGNAELEETLDFPREIRPDDVDYIVTEIYPGTQLAEKMLGEAEIQPDIWNKYMTGEAEYPIFIPEGLSREKLIKLTVEGYRRFYFSGNYLLRKIKAIRSIRDFHETLAHAVYTIKANANPQPTN